MKNPKNAQITVFIILGILLLLSTAAVIYITRISIRKEEPITKAEIEVPSWAEPINSFVTECLSEVSITALKKLGEHGGYIDINDPYLTGFTPELKEDSTESDALMFSEDFPVAYWFYMKTPNKCETCSLNSLAPRPEYIGKQVMRYIDRKIYDCINDFSEFKKQGFEVKAKAAKSDVSFTTEDTLISLDYPISIRKADSVIELSQFRTTLDLNFIRIASLANLLAMEQANNQYLESILTTIISTHSNPPDSGVIPPFIWTSDDSFRNEWSFHSVKESLRRIVAEDTNLMQVANTKDAEPIITGDPVQDGMYRAFFLDFLLVSFPTIDVKFLYNKEWPFYFDISPRDGDTIKPSSVEQDFPYEVLPTSYTTLYESYYDVSYPVLVILNDGEALKKHGENGYRFMFALETNIRNNKDMLLWLEGRGTAPPYDYNQMGAITLSGMNYNTASCEGLEPKWYCGAKEFSNEADCTSQCGSENSDATSNSNLCSFDDTLQVWYCLSKGMAYSGDNGKSECNSDCSSAAEGVTGTETECIKKSEKWKCLSDEVVYEREDAYKNEFTCKANCKAEGSLETIEATKSLFCGTEQRISAENTINVYDSTTKKPVEGVIVKYGCGIYRECTVGETDSNGKFSGRLPVCNGGGYFQLSENKDRYIGDVIEDVSTTLDTPNKFDVYLEPFRTLSADIKKYELGLVNPDGSIESGKLKSNAPVELNEDESVALIISKVKEKDSEKTLRNIITISGDKDAMQATELRLVPGKYTISATYTNKKGFVIPAECKRKCLFGALGGCLKWLYLPKEPIEMIPSSNGGVEMNDKTGYWTVTKNDIGSNKKIEFYIIKTMEPTCINRKCVNPPCIGLEELSKIGSYSKQYKTYLKPKFLN